MALAVRRSVVFASEDSSTRAGQRGTYNSWLEMETRLVCNRTTLMTESRVTVEQLSEREVDP